MHQANKIDSKKAIQSAADIKGGSHPVCWGVCTYFTKQVFAVGLEG